MARPGLIERLRAATGYVSPGERRELEAYREAHAKAWAEWQANPVAGEDFVDPLFAGQDSPHSEWMRKLGIEDFDGDDPFEEARAFLGAAERYDERLETRSRQYRERAASTPDARERRRAELLADEADAERDALDELTKELWGRVHPPAVRGRENRLKEALGCRCSVGCPRIFRSSRERAAAPRGWHPACVEELRAKQDQVVDPYVEGLLNRLPEANY